MRSIAWRAEQAESSSTERDTEETNQTRRAREGKGEREEVRAGEMLKEDDIQE